jgi:hypothetical protein
MKTFTWILGFGLMLAPLATAWAADTAAQDSDDCKQQEQQQGVGKKTSAVVCAAKAIFQSRIRKKDDSEPVEMTVGSPPMHTDDTETPGPDNWEINLVLGADLTGEEKRIEAPLFDVNYGLGDTLQLKFEVPYVFARQAQPDAGGERLVSVNGIGDSNFGVKYRLYDDKDAGLSLAIFPQVEFKTPGGRRSVSTGTTTLILPVIVMREFDHASITANAGLETSAGEYRYFASVGAGTRLTDRTAFLVEIAGTNLNATDEKHVLLNFGIRRKISDTQSISAALGRDVYAGGNLPEHTYFTFAYQKLFGK